MLWSFNDNWLCALCLLFSCPKCLVMNEDVHTQVGKMQKYTSVAVYHIALWRDAAWPQHVCLVKMHLCNQTHCETLSPCTTSARNTTQPCAKSDLKGADWMIEASRKRPGVVIRYCTVCHVDTGICMAHRHLYRHSSELSKPAVLAIAVDYCITPTAYY